MERTQIYLTKKQIANLKKAAARNKTTLSHMVREAVDVQYNVQKPLFQKRETLTEFAARIQKMGFTGPKDLATNLDDYLYGGKK